MFQIYQSMFNELKGIQFGIFMFWSICFVFFIISFIQLVIVGIKMKLSKK